MMRAIRIAALGAALGVVLGAAAAHAACVGDCDGDGMVAVNELIRGVNIALGNTGIDQCPVFDTDGDGMVGINELVAGVNAALNGCPIEPIFPSDYRDTYTEVRDCRNSSSHVAMIRVLANDVAAQAYLDEANPLPVGSILVKEEYDGVDCSNDNELVRWRAMRKEAPGFDPEDGDWHWQWVEPDRSVKYDDKSTCIACHRAPECLARDYMCTQDEDVPPRGTLSTVLENLPGALLSVAGTSATDVYAVGADPGDKGDGLGPYVLHYDGQKWERLLTGASGDLWWISVTPIDGSFYMAGAGGLILQYDLATKTFTRHQTPGTETLFGIWGTGASDLWAVGGDLDTGEGVVWHFDGQMWTVQDLSSVYPQGLPVLNKVWGRGAGDVWAVGSAEDLGVILHYDGVSWSKVDSGRAGPLFTVHGNDSIVVASGGFLDGSLLESDGGAFQDRTPPHAQQLNGVFIPPDGRGVAVGLQRSVAIRAAGNWQIREPGLNTIVDYHATWVDPDDGVWAVGGDLSDPPTRGVLAYGGKQGTIPSTITTRCPTAGTTGAGAVSYSGQIVPLLTEAHCLNASCHAGPFVSSNFDQTTYAGMFAPGDEATSLGVCPIVPGDPDHSYIVEKIGPSPRMGVQMPNTFPPLSEMQMGLIRDWILEGAPNN